MSFEPHMMLKGRTLRDLVVGLLLFAQSVFLGVSAQAALMQQICLDATGSPLVSSAAATVMRTTPVKFGATFLSRGPSGGICTGRYAVAVAGMTACISVVPEARLLYLRYDDSSLLRAFAPEWRLGFQRPPTVAPNSAARHAAWSSDLNAINETVGRLGQRALRNSGGDWRASERLFERYLGGVQNRLSRTGSSLSVEIQPAAIPGRGRVPAFRRFGDRVFATPGSRRLDAAVARPDGSLVSGYDITLDAGKPNIVQYYQDAFGPIPILDIRLP